MREPRMDYVSALRFLEWVHRAVPIDGPALPDTQTEETEK